MHSTEVAADPDRVHLRRALELAEHGRGAVSPNPMVGAVIVDGDRVLGEGWHAKLGGLHAEAAAIADAADRRAPVAGATMYVTLEPCAHHGRQPPCADAIAAAGISRLVIGSEDPTHKASGRGPGMLRDEGVEVVFAAGPEASAARQLNQAFRKHARTGRPLVTLKTAASLDGRTATTAGDSRWISGEDSRIRVHHWRAAADAVAVGIGTAIADDPTLTARGVDAARQPSRVVFDSKARLPLEGKLVRTATEAPLIVVAGAGAERSRIDALTNAGVEVVSTNAAGPSSIGEALEQLGRRSITSLLVEGGATLAGSFLDAGEVDRLELFLAPLLIGGSTARPMIAGAGIERLAEAERAIELSSEISGEDVLVRARLREW